MSRAHIRITSLGLFLIILIMGCKGKKEKAPFADKNVEQKVTQQKIDKDAGLLGDDIRPMASKAPQSAIIYWDVSIPIGGYLKSDSSRLMVFLRQQKLLYTLSKHGINTTYLSRVGKDLSPPVRVSNLFDILDKKNYTANETHLSDIFRQAAFVKYPIVIVVTDGVQSSTEGYTGSNVYAVVNAIKAALKGEIHFWVIGVKTDYKGQRFSESRNRWLTSEFLGDAPFYFWVITGDEGTGRSLVTDIVTELKGVKKGKADDDVKFVKLYPIKPAAKIPFPLMEEVEDKKQASLYSAESTQEGWVQRIKCKSTDGGVKIPFKDNFPFTGDYESVSTSWKFDELEATEEKKWLQVSNNRVVINCGGLPRRSWWKVWGDVSDVAVVTGNLVPEESSMWWQAWSTEDDWREFDKTLYLSKFVIAVARASLENKMPVVTIRVQRD